jgi:hypothetical protein
VSPPSSLASSNLDADHGDAPVRYHSIHYIMVATALGAEAHDQGDDLLVVNTVEPTSFQEA